MTLVTKFYIYRCKVQNVKLNVQAFAYEIDDAHNVELFIALLSGKSQKHIQKWSPVIEVSSNEYHFAP